MTMGEDEAETGANGDRVGDDGGGGPRSRATDESQDDPIVDESCWRFKEPPLRIFGPPGIARFITTSLEVSKTIMPGNIIITELDLAYRDIHKVDARRGTDVGDDAVVSPVGDGNPSMNVFHRYGRTAFGDHAHVEEPVCVDPSHPTLRRIFVRSLQADHPDTLPEKRAPEDDLEREGDGLISSEAGDGNEERSRGASSGEGVKRAGEEGPAIALSNHTDYSIPAAPGKYGASGRRMMGMKALLESEMDMADRWPRWPTAPPSCQWSLPIFHLSTHAHGTVTIRAAPILHRVPCIGYVIQEPRQPGHIDTEKGIALGLPPGPKYRLLKQGVSVFTSKGAEIRPEDVVTPTRPGRTVVILGDTSNPRNVLDLLNPAESEDEVDLLVHESTFSNDDWRIALRSGHSTSSMAGIFARQCRAKVCAVPLRIPPRPC